MGDKNLKTKVLGKEFEEEPFFKRVFLKRKYKSFFMSTVFNAPLFQHIRIPPHGRMLSIEQHPAPKMRSISLM